MSLSGNLGRVPTTARDAEGALVDVWRELLDRHARISCALERALHEHGLGVSEFEVLDLLAGCEHGCLRIQELADTVHLSQSALSRVVGRLEADGLVTRSLCENDRRGVFAGITEAGRARHAEAKPAHRAVLRDALS
jgi:DNA-binding MarR family transcriptional regulator